MKIALAVGWFYPDHTGGSEAYVAALARELVRLGHSTTVLTPHASDGIIEHEGLRVRRYASGSVEAFARCLGEERPDVSHLHSWTQGLNHAHAARSAAMGFRTMMTFHTAEAFCQRGTMLRWGRAACDGEVRPVRCSACHGQGRGLGAPWALGVAALGRVVGSGIGPAGGRLRTALGLPGRLAARRTELAEVWDSCERVFAVCDWMREALSRNGCPRGKLTLARQGSPIEPRRRGRPSDQGPVRFGFLGRLHPTKGARLLIEAFRRVESGGVSLELLGAVADDQHHQELRRIGAGDARIRWVEPGSNVAEWLGGVDALVVPSQIMETGPLVVYEAFASGVPVIGARLGGIAELVHDGVDGLLFEHDSVDALALALGRFASDPSLRGSLKNGIGTVRTMRDVAGEMDGFYRKQAT